MKLIRDKIIDRMLSEGKQPEYRQVSDSELLPHLYGKLIEESNECVIDQNQEEIADVLEVIEAIVQKSGWSMDQILQIKATKKQEKGGFEKGILLINI